MKYSTLVALGLDASLARGEKLWMLLSTAKGKARRRAGVE